MGGVVPGSSDVALWDSTVTTANTVLLGADASWAGIRVVNPGGAPQINAGNTLSLGASGIDMTAAAQAFTLTCAVVVASDQAWNAGARQLSIYGPLNMNGHTVAASGTSKIQFKNMVSGNGTLVTSHPNTQMSAGAFATNMAVIVLPGGLLQFDSGTGTLSPPRVQSLMLNGSTLVAAGVTPTNTVDAISGALTVSSGIVATVTISPSATRNEQLLANSLVRTNNGIVLLRGTYLGKSTIASATANSANFNLGNAPTMIGGSGAAGSPNISIIPWAIGDTNAANAGLGFVTYDVSNGIRPLDPSLEYDTSFVGGVTNDHNVMIGVFATNTINSDAAINALCVQNNSLVNGTGRLAISSGAIFAKISGNITAVINNAIDFGGAEGVIGCSAAGNAYGLILGGSISGSNGMTIHGPNVGKDADVTFQSPCTYTGNTYVVGQLNANANNALPNGSRLGDVFVYGRLEVNASTIQINGLNGTGSIWIQHSNNGPFYVGDNNANGSFSGTVIPSGSLTGLSFFKIGTGTQILSSTNSLYTGSTTILNGVLSVATINSVTGARTSSSLGAPAAGNATIAIGNGSTNAQLTYTGPGETSDRVINLAGTTGGATVDASGSGALVLATNVTATGAGIKTLTLSGSSTNANAILGAIANNSPANRTSLLKTGAGLWVLGGTNGYTGPTTVSNGTFGVNGSIASLTTVLSNAVLTGTGAIATNNATALTVNAGGIVNPGAVGTIGTLTVTGNVAFASGSVLRVDLGPSGTGDLLAVSGSVTGSGTMLISATTTNKGSWKVMSATGGIAPAVTTDAVGLTVVKRNSNTEVWLTQNGGTAVFMR